MRIHTCRNLTGSATVWVCAYVCLKGGGGGGGGGVEMRLNERECSRARDLDRMCAKGGGGISRGEKKRRALRETARRPTENNWGKKEKKETSTGRIPRRPRPLPNMSSTATHTHRTHMAAKRHYSPPPRRSVLSTINKYALAVCQPPTPPHLHVPSAS